MKLFFLNGWKLHKGPCYNCSKDDEGYIVTARRKQYIIDKNDKGVFGIWKLEVELKGTELSKQKIITDEVNDHIEDTVIMVNENEGWELESSEISLDVDMTNVPGRRFDIM